MSNSNKPTWLSGFWFVIVGIFSALIHVLVFEGLRPLLRLELANFGGFLFAFLVGFWGHRFLSFQDTKTPVQQSFFRFSVTAIAGFLTNTLCLIFLVRWFEWLAPLALVAGLVVAAVQTFALSRWWAFKR